jgi:hypothetical protein
MGEFALGFGAIAFASLKLSTNLEREPASIFEIGIKRVKLM